MKAIILAAGYGTRLREVAQDRAKPLLPVAGRPLIDHILFRIEEIEAVDSIYVVTNAKFHDQFSAWKSEYRGPLPLYLLNDGTTSNETRLGPVGDMRYVVQQAGIDEDILVIAGDNLFEFSLLNMYQFFRDVDTSVVALHDLHDKEKIKKRFGNAELDAQGRIVRFVEKPEEPLSTLAATCCYMIPRKDLPGLERCIAQYGNAEAGNFMTWLTENSRVYGFVFSESCIDVGTPADYHHANAIYNGKK